MVEETLLFSTFHLVLAMFSILLDLVIAGIVIWRFRSTVTTWLVAGGFVAFAFVRIISNVFFFIAAPRLAMEGTGHFAASALFNLAYILVSLLVAAGVGFIPRSLRKLGG